jgi:hypothetical protein
MRLIVTYSTGRAQTEMMRALINGERRLVVSCPWQQPPAATFAAIADQLTEAERVEVEAAFGLAGPGGSS